MYKHIKFIARPVLGSKDMEVMILEQTHRENGFGEHGRYTFDYKDVTLYSVGCPEVREYDNEVFVRGYDYSLDRRIMRMSYGFYVKLREAVEAYNESFKE